MWRRKLHEKLLDTIDLRRRDFTQMSDDEIRAETETVIREPMGRESALPSGIDRAALMHEVLNEAVGLGPLEDLLADESVSEIMVNRFDEVYVERLGRLVPARDIVFERPRRDGGHRAHRRAARTTHR